MVTTSPPRHRVHGLAAILGVSLALISTGPVVLATDRNTADPADPEAGISGAALEEATPEELRVMVGELTDERDVLARSLERFEDLYDPLEADRQLLFELRKGVPETRPEAEAQIERLRKLANSSDPARLGRLVDRVAESAPEFFDWRFTEFATAQEATQAYIASGANAFDSSMSEFRNEVLLSVANRLDGLLTTIDRAR
jgi:hypothetical protein